VAVTRRDAGTAIGLTRLSYHTGHIEPRRTATSTQPPANCAATLARHT